MVSFKLNRPGDDSPEDDTAEDDLTSDEGGGKKKGKNRLRSSMKLLNQLVQGGLDDKKKDEVDRLIEAMRKEEEEKLEDIVLDELAQDPKDLRYALEDIKVKGLKKTMSKMPKKSKNKYVTKLLGGESPEEEDLIEDEEDPDMFKALQGRYEKPEGYDEYPEASGSMEDPYGHYSQHYDTRYLTRGAYPPAPPAPPVPDYGVSDEELYKRNLALLEKNLEHEVPEGFMHRRIMRIPNYGHHPHSMSRPPSMSSGRRRSKDVKHTAPQRAFIMKKRGEAAEVS